MTEDAAYRASTQYKLWSFTPAQLSTFRASTNALAASRVRAAIKRAREAQKLDGEDEGEEKEVDCLTVSEEEILVGYYCGKTMELADLFEFPTNVKATAVQYLKRFYLSNSPMTYHPKPLMLTSLFLATKTENHYTRLTAFASRIPGKKPTTPEDVIAPEFLLTQGLRFTFEVRHPFRGLEGGIMSLLGLAGGEPGAKLRALDPADGAATAATAAAQDAGERIRAAHAKAKHLLKTSAQLTDAYFVTTPAHLWLAALYAADAPLCRFFLATLPPLAGPGEDPGARLLAHVAEVAGLLGSPLGYTTDVAEARRVDRKVYFCRNPEKVDLKALNRRQRVGGRGSGGEEGGEKGEDVRTRDGEVFG
ncbi:hypothetical protein FGG08_001420 [Glutinoglossum americanum]|uniref:RNA polymerase II holoenzyme cyclin-like subunit n=1 Tax=Glutinoglossum americanum TaxID=1670608 RepID=A0A9P8L5A9_9PEZI|nr:hypothetical protein FGG08_001420 [Glutinoglossum americanum]